MTGSPSSSPPPNWPSHLPYLSTTSIPSPLLPPSLHGRYCTAPSDTTLPVRATQYRRIKVGIRRIDADTPFIPRTFVGPSPSSTPRAVGGEKGTGRHPALGQYGLFALQDIPPHTFVRPYLGVVHVDAESDRESEYDMKVEYLPHDGIGSVAIDATSCGNEARFVNDYRGIMPRPNCRLDNWSSPAPSSSSSLSSTTTSGAERQQVGMGIYTDSKPVRAGTELTVNYGKGFWSRFLNQPDDDEEGVQRQEEEEGGSRDGAKGGKLDTIQARLARQRQRLMQSNRGRG
ncbi:uncharacterized protein PFL1_06911 [Pseudozyma flocculosa PF-1]|uniref:SET domain-containing protein n=1 Tax=Pseudozyma flocculosa PF-1 TaxID=1277687 RepID=A0A061H295_9BASI|nr:uncharacterized protein PFL1_06911 [Pseudozyma flocculosa PF-1]EPQ26334.1 hypothetical protein PFL1_06911 [Pseudozyma flocculosa PF-1]